MQLGLGGESLVGSGGGVAAVDAHRPYGGKRRATGGGGSGGGLGPTTSSSVAEEMDWLLPLLLVLFLVRY